VSAAAGGLSGRWRAILAYAPWHLRDGAAKALVPVGLFAALGGIPILVMARRAGLEALRTPGRWQDNAIQAYEQILPMALLLGAIVLMSGVASLDRDRQHVRFLFPRPVVPWALYLQQFVVSLALFVVAVTLIPLGFGAIIAEVPIAPVVKSAALLGFLYGSLGFLCGALLNRDGLLFIALIVLAGVLQQAERAGQLGRVWSMIAEALPPVAAAGQARIAWFADQSAATGDLRLVILYSAGMTVAALALVHWRPLVR
jgi:hypothetical protein